MNDHDEWALLGALGFGPERHAPPSVVVALREAIAAAERRGGDEEREACGTAVADVDCLNRAEFNMREKCAAAIRARSKP